jgi:hypothetical protein
MECYRRAMIGEQTFKGRREKPRPSEQALPYLCSVARCSQPAPRQRPTEGHGGTRSCARRRPGCGRHGRDHGGRGSIQIRGTTPAKQIAHAPQSSVRSADKTQEPVPVTCDAERPLPDSRRNVAGCFKGE